MTEQESQAATPNTDVPEETTEAPVETTETQAPATAENTTEETTEESVEEKPQVDVSNLSEADVRNLQDKYHKLLDTRNEYNGLARTVRDERNALHEERRLEAEKLQENKSKRDEANQQAKVHRDRRNEYQTQAKSLIAQKRGKTGGLERSLPVRIRKLKGDIERSLERQETSVLSVEKERDLIDGIRKQRAELAELERQFEEQRATMGDLDDADKGIDELFAKADEEHEKVVEFQKLGQAHHEKFVEALKAIKILRTEADAKHKAYIAYKTKADDSHNKAMELREQVVAVRGERRAQWQARRNEISEFNKSAKNLSDPKALEEASESALDALKSGGKISLGF